MRVTIIEHDEKKSTELLSKLRLLGLSGLLVKFRRNTKAYKGMNQESIVCAIQVVYGLEGFTNLYLRKF